MKQMQVMIQSMQYAAAPHVTGQYYRGRQDYGGRGYHSNKSSYLGLGGHGTQNNRNWHGGRGGQANSNFTHYCWTHVMCDHPGKDCRTPADGHQNNKVWCNKMLESNRNCTWQVRSIPDNKINAEEIKPSNTSELWCNSIVDPLQHATIIAKADSGLSNNY